MWNGPAIAGPFLLLPVERLNHALVDRSKNPKRTFVASSGDEINTLAADVTFGSETHPGDDIVVFDAIDPEFGPESVSHGDLVQASEMRGIGAGHHERSCLNRHQRPRIGMCLVVGSPSQENRERNHGRRPAGHYRSPRKRLPRRVHLKALRQLSRHRIDHSRLILPPESQPHTQLSSQTTHTDTSPAPKPPKSLCVLRAFVVRAQVPARARLDAPRKSP